MRAGIIMTVSTTKMKLRSAALAQTKHTCACLPACLPRPTRNALPRSKRFVIDEMDRVIEENSAEVMRLEIGGGRGVRGSGREYVRSLNVHARHALICCITQVTIIFSPPKTGISLYESLSSHDQVR